MNCTYPKHFASEQIKGMRRVGHAPDTGVTRGLRNVLLCKREGKKSLGKPRRIWEDNIKIYF
jgi:hypothetical protein